MRYLFTAFLLCTTAAMAQSIPTLKEGAFCSNYPNGKPVALKPSLTSGELRKVVLTAPNAICNDGSQAVMYVRAAKPGAVEPDGPSANRWLIHLEGGGGCSNFLDCLVRWCGLGFYTVQQMSSDFLGDFINKGGLLNRNDVNRLGDRNLVMLNYCSSDSWGGRKSDLVYTNPDNPTQSYKINFQGANIVAAAFAALEQGVPDLPKLTDATDILFSGDSAGASGVRRHLDRLAARMKTLNPNTRVRGQMEATFSPDFNGRHGVPAGDPTDPPYAAKTARYNEVTLPQNQLLDDSCLAAHPTAPYLCDDSGYVELNHITTPFFQIQDEADGNLAENYEESVTDFTMAQFSQRLFDQLSELTNLKTTAIEKAAITTAPGVVGRLCGVHVMWGDNDGYLGKKIRGLNNTTYSYQELLWNWMNGLSPTMVLEPRPPSTPDDPVLSPACAAKAPTAPPNPAIASASNANYNFNAPVAPNSIVASFGTNLANTTAVTSTIPWPTTLGGVTVTITDSLNASRLAPLYYVSPTQVIYLIPTGTALGTARVNIGGQQSPIEIAAVSPGIYSANSTGQGAAAATYIRVAANGARTEGYLFDTTTRSLVGIPATATDQIYLILYGTGMRGGTATATVGGVNVPVAGPVAQSQFPGLDQINLGPLPARIGLGAKEIIIRQGNVLANTVMVGFKAP